MTFEEALNKKRGLQSPYLYTDNEGSLPKLYKVRIIPSNIDDISVFNKNYIKYAYSGRGEVPDDFALQYSQNNDFIVVGIRIEGNAIFIDYIG